MVTECSNFSETFISAEHFNWQDSHAWEYSVLWETTMFLSYSTSYHEASHRTNQCLYCDFASGGTGSEMDAGWSGPVEQMNDLKQKPSHLMQALGSTLPCRGYWTGDINNRPKELMHHEGQRASEATYNGRKDSTSILHIQLSPGFSVARAVGCSESCLLLSLLRYFPWKCR